MDVRVENNEHVWCDGCDVYINYYYTTETTYYYHDAVDQVDYGDYDFVFTEDCRTFEVRTCDDCGVSTVDNFVHDKVYICGECEHIYTELSEAVSCCK